MMYKSIKDFSEQLSFEPKVTNEDRLKRMDRVIVLGMGGSQLAASILHSLKPEISIINHRDYGLPKLNDEDLQNSLIVGSSYSGNTEEVLDGVNEALKRNLNVAVIAVGGKLLEIAKREQLPYVEIPNTGIQPRAAIGFSFKALTALLGDKRLLNAASKFSGEFKPLDLRTRGSDLAKKLYGYVPVIYASSKNSALAYTWKIKFNETGKVPAFYNLFPELNHNEMTGFDVAETTRPLSKNFYFLVLRDSKDNAVILKRMDVLAKLYAEQGFPVEVVNLEEGSDVAKVFSSLILVDWAAYYLAEKYQVDSNNVPLVEEFKRLIK